VDKDLKKKTEQHKTERTPLYLNIIIEYKMTPSVLREQLEGVVVSEVFKL